MIEIGEMQSADEFWDEVESLREEAQREWDQADVEYDTMKDDEMQGVWI